LKILIADDDPGSLKLLQTTLQAEGHRVLSCSDGEQALRLLRRETIDLVISDILMPNMDGYRFCYEIRRHGVLCSVPVILYSATYLSASDRQLALDFGASLFLQKPASASDLQRAIREATAGDLHPPVPSGPPADLEVMKRYSERLVRKIEEKNLELIRSTADLQASEEMFRQIAENISEVFYVTDAKTENALYVSPACERIWGQSQEQILARPAAWTDSIHPEDRQRVGAAFLENRDSGGFDEIFRLQHPDGRIRWARSRAFPVRDKEGRIYRYTGLASDVTELKLAQDALAEKATLAALAADVGNALTRSESLPEILRHSTEAIVQHLGAAFARIWTLNAQKNVLELQASSGLYTHLDGAHSRVPVGKYKIGLIARERLPHLTNDVLNDPKVGDREWARRESMVSFAGYPLMVEDELVGVMAMFARAPLTQYALDGLRTIANTIAIGIKRKLAEQTQAGLEGQLRQAQKMEAVGSLAGGVAHDFNNLLTAILGYSSILLAHLPEGDPARQNLQEILKAGERAASLTNQLLAFSRKQVLQPKILDLNVLASNLERMLRRLISEDIELSTCLEGNLGQVKADPGQIEQVIMNLVVNARDAMPTGGKLTIETANVTLGEDYASKHLGAKPGRYVMLAVADTGVGMDAETQTRIFEPFFTTKEVGKGTGLGLATVYGIVKQSEGYISVYSEPSQGTTFKTYLPRIDQPAETATASQAAPIPRGTETILLVEDEEGVRRLARLILEEQGYAIIEASSASSALAAAEKHVTRIHLVLTDVVMPGMNGRELSQRLSKIRPSVRMLFMSGYTGDTIVRHGVLEPGIAYLQKPFTPMDLALKVRQVLDTPRAQLEETAGTSGSAG
jgi:PAS domain S-box-containing protein